MEIEVGKSYTNNAGIIRKVLDVQPSFPGAPDWNVKYIYTTNRPGYAGKKCSCFIRTMQGWAKSEVSSATFTKTRVQWVKELPDNQVYMMLLCGHNSDKDFWLKDLVTQEEFCKDMGMDSAYDGAALPSSVHGK